MRIEIANKFVMGFIIVIGSIVAVNFLVPLLGIPPAWQQLFATAVAILVGLLLGWTFSKAFTANVRRITGVVERMSYGDLSRNIRLPVSTFPDETSDLADSLNLVVDSLRRLVGQIRSSSVKVSESAQGLSASSEEMSASAHEVANTIEQISRGAETQAEMVEKASRIIKEMAVSIGVIASSAKKVSSSASDTAETARNGGEMAGTALRNMKQVLEEAQRSGEMVLSFGEHVQKIGKIVDVITGIAQKTNLLALNATIEAARAGEYGRGFAVVAEEISKLAESTSNSAGEITSLIETIRDENVRIQESIKASVREIDGGRSAIDTTGGAFEQIIQQASNTQSKANSIAELSAKQNSGAEEMVQAIDEIARVTEDNAASTEQVSAATEEQSAAMEEMAHSAGELSALAEELLAMVRRFEIGAEQGPGDQAAKMADRPAEHGEHLQVRPAES